MREPAMITTAEAVQLSEHLATLKEMEWAIELLNHYKKNPPHGDDFRWIAGVVISTAFAAGKVQGIREERSRRHEHH